MFDYRTNINEDQFFKYGYAEVKMLLACDTVCLVKRKLKQLKVQRSLSAKRVIDRTHRTRGGYSQIVGCPKANPAYQGGQRTFSSGKQRTSMRPSALKKRSETTKKYYSNAEEGGNRERISHSPVRFKADGGQGTVDAYQRILGAAVDESKQEKRGY